MLHNISQQRRSHMKICNAGLGLALHGPVQSDPVWRCLVRHFNCKFNATSYI